jgi:hypothetical protein
LQGKLLNLSILNQLSFIKIYFSFLFKGEKKQTNYHRQMLSDLVKGILPRSWRRYTIPVGTTVIQWITDFSLRVKQLQQVSQVVSQGGARELQTVTVWLGGLFNPEAYVTATRQCVAQVFFESNYQFKSVDIFTKCISLTGKQLVFGRAIPRSNN